MFDLLTAKASLQSFSWELALAALLLAVLLSGLVVLTYKKTVRGLSFSSNDLEAMVLAAVVAAGIMMAIGDSIGRGLGMMGALAIIRFRTNIRETRDIVFLFACLGIGIGCGVFALNATVVGCLVFCVTAFVLSKTNWGGSELYNGVLRMQMPVDFTGNEELQKVLRKNCVLFVLASVRQAKQGAVLEVSYHVQMKDNTNYTAWLEELKGVGVSQVQFAARDQGGSW